MSKVSERTERTTNVAFVDSGCHNATDGLNPATFIAGRSTTAFPVRNLMLRLFAFLFVAMASIGSARAATLTLGCSGTLTTTDMPKDQMASDPKAENIVDFSLVIDFERQSISGFWWQLNGTHDLIPIVAVDANSVTFKGTKKTAGMDDSIEGSVDRITGKIDATETLYSPRNGGLRSETWDLRCKPTKPLF
jgi:hypothetical protein